MTLTDVEQRFLARQPRGHLATIGPDGTPQVKPLGFTYNAALGTIDIAGFNMARSAKYRNIQVNPRVAFVVDEVTEASMEGAHFLEIRGTAEAAPVPAPPTATWQRRSFVSTHGGSSPTTSIPTGPACRPETSLLRSPATGAA